MATEFEWEESKASSNLLKHGITFEEAISVFANPLAIIFDDEGHSEAESREIIIGHSVQNRASARMLRRARGHGPPDQRPTRYSTGAKGL